jgi:hypothetical protein
MRVSVVCVCVCVCVCMVCIKQYIQDIVGGPPANAKLILQTSFKIFLTLMMHLPLVFPGTF